MTAKMPKYGNKKTAGYDSKREAGFAYRLNLLRNAADPGERVIDIKEQRRFELIPVQRGADGKVVERKCEYVADFVVTYGDGRVVVYDVKGFKTPEYKIKRKLLRYMHGIAIVEV